MTYKFVNAQIRSILNGLGFNNRDANEPEFPLSYDESPLEDQQTIGAVMAFQRYFKLDQDGIVGPKTKAMAERALDIMHYDLDVILQPEPRLRPQAPLYGPQTAEAVANFRNQYGFEPDGNPTNDRVASLAVRRRLNDLMSERTGEKVTALV